LQLVPRGATFPLLPRGTRKQHKKHCAKNAGGSFGGGGARSDSHSRAISRLIALYRRGE
jgi:hypothetical protein